MSPFWRRGTRTMAARRQSVEMGVRLGPLELPNPIVVASGTFGHGDEVARYCDPSELGAVTVKSLAPYEWPGNPAPRLHMTNTSSMLNSVGLEGPGVEHWVAHELPALRARRARVIASVWGRTVDDFALAAKMLHPARAELIAVEANVSCPNLDDRSRMFAHAPETTAAAVSAVADAGLDLPLFAKLSPNIADLTDVVGAALGAGATGLTLINTVFGLLVDAEHRRPVLGAGGGGLSGPAIKPVALRVVHDVARAYPGTPIIGTGGVTSGLDAVDMMMAGASAVGVGTATFHDTRASLRILRELAQWCRAHGVRRVGELVGTLEADDA